MAAADEPPTAVAEAQNIQAQLKKMGIEIEIETLELGVYVDRWLKADFDAAVALNGGNPDPDIMFFRYWHSTGNLNKVAAYKDPEIDKLLEQGRSSVRPRAAQGHLHCKSRRSWPKPRRGSGCTSATNTASCSPTSRASRPCRTAR